MTTQPTALRLADALQAGADDPMWANHCEMSKRTAGKAAAELRRLHEENQKLRSVMVAAAEEIKEHWEAHCDEEGYGPVNLMRRLESGIASKYNYTAGDFARLVAANQELLEALDGLVDAHKRNTLYNGAGHWDSARAAIAKHSKEQPC